MHDAQHQTCRLLLDSCNAAFGTSSNCSVSCFQFCYWLWLLYWALSYMTLAVSWLLTRTEKHRWLLHSYTMLQSCHITEHDHSGTGISDKNNVNNTNVSSSNACPWLFSGGMRSPSKILWSPNEMSLQPFTLFSFNISACGFVLVGLKKNKKNNNNNNTLLHFANFQASWEWSTLGIK